MSDIGIVRVDAVIREQRDSGDPGCMLDVPAVLSGAAVFFVTSIVTVSTIHFDRDNFLAAIAAVPAFGIVTTG